MVSSDRDDDALSWGGEVDDPTHANGAVPVAGRVEGDTPTPSRPDGGSVLLVTYGILGGVYLLCAIGWIAGVQRDQFSSNNLFFEIMYQFGEFLAIASPVLWFGVTFAVTLNRRPGIRLLLLLAGVLLLAPWPFISSGSVA